MRKLLFLFLGLTVGLNTQAQHGHWCGTQENQAFLDSLDARIADGRFREDMPRPEAITYIPIQYHLITRGDGTGAKRMDQVLELICDLNQVYGAFDIQFYLKDYPKTYASTRYDVTSYTVGDALFSTYNIEDAVNVYFASLDNFNSNGLLLCGYANLPGTGVAPAGKGKNARGGVMLNVNGTCTTPYSTKTFPHELGHFISLLHPFQTTSTNPTAFGAELVTRSGNPPAGKRAANCSTAGDRLCDTPSDFIDLSNASWNNSTCRPAAATVDANGDVFRPDSSLIMAYAPDRCVNRFSQGQIASILTTLQLPIASVDTRSYLISANPPSTSALVQPTLVTPANLSTGTWANFAYFEWNKSAGAEKYLLQTARDAGFNSLYFEQIVDTNFVLYEGDKLDANRTIYWRVRPISRGFTCAPNSSSWRFTTGNKLGTGLNDLKNNTGINIYPTLIDNDRKFNIAVEKNRIKTLNVEMLNLNGQVVARNSYFDLVTGAVEMFDFNDVASGMYIVRMIADDEIITQKIFVQ